jgi:hypothetical protein
VCVLDYSQLRSGNQRERTEGLSSLLSTNHQPCKFYTTILIFIHIYLNKQKPKISSPLVINGDVNNQIFQPLFWFRCYALTDNRHKFLFLVFQISFFQQITTNKSQNASKKRKQSFRFYAFLLILLYSTFCLHPFPIFVQYVVA